jgi:hypothetical protein
MPATHHRASEAMADLLRVAPCTAEPATHSSVEDGMCDKCTELDERIEHYRVLLVRITDPQTVEAIAALIDRLRQEKAALHAET